MGQGRRRCRPDELRSGDGVDFAGSATGQASRDRRDLERRPEPKAANLERAYGPDCSEVPDRASSGIAGSSDRARESHRARTRTRRLRAHTESRWSMRPLLRLEHLAPRLEVSQLAYKTNQSKPYSTLNPKRLQPSKTNSELVKTNNLRSLRVRKELHDISSDTPTETRERGRQPCEPSLILIKRKLFL